MRSVDAPRIAARASTDSRNAPDINEPACPRAPLGAFSPLMGAPRCGRLKGTFPSASSPDETPAPSDFKKTHMLVESIHSDVPLVPFWKSHICARLIIKWKYPPYDVG